MTDQVEDDVEQGVPDEADESAEGEQIDRKSEVPDDERPQ